MPNVLNKCNGIQHDFRHTDLHIVIIPYAAPERTCYPQHVTQCTIAWTATKAAKGDLRAFSCVQKNKKEKKKKRKQIELADRWDGCRESVHFSMIARSSDTLHLVRLGLYLLRRGWSLQLALFVCCWPMLTCATRTNPERASEQPKCLCPRWGPLKRC